MAHKTVQTLLNKPMDRRQFLAHIGAGALIITGISGILRSLVDYSPFKGQKAAVGGYGSSAYGGQKR